MGPQERTLRLVLAGESLSHVHDHLRTAMKGGVVGSYPGKPFPDYEQMQSDLRRVSGIPDARVFEVTQAALIARVAATHN